MSEHGGRRNGAGRKPASKTKKVALIAMQAAAEGIGPVEVMLANMRRAWQAQDWDKAQQCAVDAAPYTQPKLAAVKHSGDPENPLTMLHDILESVNGTTRGLPNGQDTNRQSH